MHSVSNSITHLQRSTPRQNRRGDVHLRRGDVHLRRGFSLLEIVIVSIMLAIMAATIVPKFTVAARQIEDKAILEVEDLLRMYAFRNGSGTQQIGLYYDKISGEVSLWIKDLDPANPEGPRVWQQDRLSSPVQLPDGMLIVEALVDGVSMRDENWNIPSHADGSRPRIELLIAGREKTAALVLETYTTVPVRVGEPGVVVREQVDLDDQGAAMEIW